MSRIQNGGRRYIASLQRLFSSGFPATLKPVLLPALCFVSISCAPVEFNPSFGDPYEIIDTDVPGGPDKPPQLVGDWLMMLVAYPGGCTDHTFTVESTVKQDTAHVWVRHNSGGDSCEAYITDELSLELPTGVLGSRIIAMHDPAGDPPHLLRW